MWTRARPRYPKRCCTAPDASANSVAWTTATHSSIPSHWRSSAASPSMPTRHPCAAAIWTSRCSTPPATWTSPPKPNVCCVCSTTRFSWSPAPTACRATPKPCGDCSPDTRYPPSSSSTRWMPPAPTGTRRSPICAVVCPTPFTSCRRLPRPLTPAPVLTPMLVVRVPIPLAPCRLSRPPSGGTRKMSRMLPRSMNRRWTNIWRPAASR